MLRLIVLLLLLANGLYFAWSHRYLQMYGFAPHTSGEPQRVQQQIKPDAVQLLTAAELKKVEAQMLADAGPKECLQAGPFSDEEAAALRRVLNEALPAGGWQVDPVKVSSRWVVYVGKLAKGETLAKKTADLAALGIKAIPVANPDLQPGLVLAGFETEAAAKAELARLAPRGIRGIKVLQERQAATVQQLRVPAATEAIKLRLQDVKAALQGHGLKSCS